MKLAEIFIDIYILANFTLPDDEDPAFAEVLYTDLNKEEAKSVVELYNKVSYHLSSILAFRIISVEFFMCSLKSLKIAGKDRIISHMYQFWFKYIFL